MKTQVIWVLAVAVVLVLSGCALKDCHLYRVKQGRHVSVGTRALRPTTDAFTFTIPEGFKGEPARVGITKVFGYSDGFRHHRHSVRLGILWDEKTDRVKVLAYIYQNGKRHWHELGTGMRGGKYPASITVTDSEYVVTFSDSIYRTERTGRGPLFVLYPYFGGTLPAPQDMEFMLCF